MNTPKPGDWYASQSQSKFESWHVYTTQGSYGIFDATAPHGAEGSKANAVLAASAPDLLDALQALFEHCAMVHKHWGDGDNSKQASAAIAAGRAAIAKAQGGQTT